MSTTPREDKYRSKYHAILNRYPDDKLQTENEIKDFITELAYFVNEAIESTESVFFAKRNIEKFTGMLKNYHCVGDNFDVDFTTETPAIPYELAMEKSGFVQGYIYSAQRTNAHAFDPKFIEAVDTILQFVKEHPPVITMMSTLPPFDLSGELERIQALGSETK